MKKKCVFMFKQKTAFFYFIYFSNFHIIYNLYINRNHIPYTVYKMIKISMLTKKNPWFIIDNELS